MAGGLLGAGSLLCWTPVLWSGEAGRWKRFWAGRAWGGSGRRRNLIFTTGSGPLSSKH
jgi:hypothetical protein